MGTTRNTGMRTENGILYFDKESKEEMLFILMGMGLKGRVLVTEGGKNPRIFLDPNAEAEFLRSKGLDPERLKNMGEYEDRRYTIDPAAANMPGSTMGQTAAEVDPGNIILPGRGGSYVRVVNRYPGKDYPFESSSGLFLKVIEKTCPDEWSAVQEERIMKGLREGGHSIAQIYRREGKVLDIEMVSPTIYDYANKEGRDQIHLENLLYDAMIQKLQIYDDLPGLVTQDVIDEIQRQNTEKMSTAFQVDKEFASHYQDALKVLKALDANTEGNFLLTQFNMDAMNLLSIFENSYGWMLREERQHHARPLNDEYTKNRGIVKGKTVAFDFTPKYDIPQLDDLFLLQAGGNNLAEDVEMELVSISSEAQGRDFWDYYATYICASPMRSYLQMRHIIETIDLVCRQLEMYHATGLKVSPYKDPQQYIREFAEMYSARVMSNIREFFSYAQIAKTNAQKYGEFCQRGGLESQILDNTTGLHNLAMASLGQQMIDCLEHHNNTPFLSNAPGEVTTGLVGKIKDAALQQMF